MPRLYTVTSLVPLTPAVLHVLLALAEGQRHGYAILKDVERQTDGAVRMGPGTLYGTLQRLMDQGMVEEADGPARPVDRARPLPRPVLPVRSDQGPLLRSHHPPTGGGTR